MPQPTGQSDAFVMQITACQSRLYAYILSLAGDREQAREVLQETNLVIWRKADQFEPGTNFIAWAFKIARLQLMAYRQKIARDRLVFDDDLLLDMADIFDEGEAFNARQDALAHCVEQIAPNHRNLLRIRYTDGLSVKEIASQLDKSANAIAKVLHRTRLALMKCIEQRVSEERS
ncbi:MAG: sigma-70 family RNA polymerase sigma factor [Phycisphaeraceae bacterium]